MLMVKRTFTREHPTESGCMVLRHVQIVNEHGADMQKTSSTGHFPVQPYALGI